MKPLILVTEDNPDVLFNIKMTLEFNGFEVLTAVNGKEAIKNLTELNEKVPDLIISDIMMPEMDGYEFYSYIAEHTKWALIPFLFLTAKASPEDIRFGKMLGIDDYITKPFEEEDLIAIIKGKIARNKKETEIRKKIENKIISKLKVEMVPSVPKTEKDSINLLYMRWDETYGPEIIDYYPKDEKYFTTLQEVGVQLFHASISIYGSNSYSKAQGILLNVENIQKSGYIFFDSKKSDEVRGGERLFMLTTLAPKISYLNSLQIGEIFQTIGSRIKQSQNWNLKSSWENICEILTKSSVIMD